MIRTVVVVMMLIATQAAGQEVQNLSVTLVRGQHGTVAPNIKVNGKVKKGKCIAVELDGVFMTGQNTNVVIHNEEKSELVKELNLRNLFTMSIPNNTKAGRGYQIAIVQGGQTYYSNTFSIKRRVALAWYTLPVAAAGLLMVLKHQDDGVGFALSPPETPTN